MTEKEIFLELFKIAENTGSKKGAVATALVRDGKIIMSAGSQDSPNRHAEDLLLEKVSNQNFIIQPDDILYVTLQPCGERTPGGGGEKFGDCATHVIGSPIKHIVYAFPDRHYSEKVNDRFDIASISHRYFNDPEITERARKIFNDTMVDKDYIEKKGDRAFF